MWYLLPLSHLDICLDILYDRSASFAAFDQENLSISSATVKSCIEIHLVLAMVLYICMVCTAQC